MAKSTVSTVEVKAGERRVTARHEVKNLNIQKHLGIVTNMYPEDGSWRHTYFVDANGVERCHKVTDQTSALKELILLQTRVERAKQGQRFTMPESAPPLRTRIIDMAESWPICRGCMAPAPAIELREFGGLCSTCSWDGGVSDVIVDDTVIEDGAQYLEINF
jgi:hypothetical protein